MDLHQSYMNSAKIEKIVRLETYWLETSNEPVQSVKVSTVLVCFLCHRATVNKQQSIMLIIMLLYFLYAFFC
jgi:hypothetical protein